MEKLSNAELIAALRYCVAYDPEKPCDQCVAYPKCLDMEKDITLEAARRLEELAKPGEWVCDPPQTVGEIRSWYPSHHCSLCGYKTAIILSEYCPGCGHPMITEK